MDDPSVVLPPHWESIYLPLWFQEDFPSLDVASAIVGDAPALGKLTLKSNQKIILAGMPFFDAIFKWADLSNRTQISWNYREGQEIDGPALVATIKGPATVLLRGERIALNVLARCSSIATFAHHIQSLSTCRIAATRKTTPGFRMMEKYALAVAGIDTHRLGAAVGGCIMLKENHIDLCIGDIPLAMEKMRKMASFTTKIEVECRDMQQARIAVNYGAEIVMLDNFRPSLQDLLDLRAINPHILIELSGGITPDNIATFHSLENVFISLGALTHSVPYLDFSMKITRMPE